VGCLNVKRANCKLQQQADLKHVPQFAGNNLKCWGRIL